VCILTLPLLFSGDLPGTSPLVRFPVFDPSGIAALHQAVYTTVPDVKHQSIAIGWQSPHIPAERIGWNGIPLSAGFFAARALALVYPAILLAAAVLIFDRFDPARTRRSSAPHREPVTATLERRAGPDPIASTASLHIRYVPTRGDPSPWRAIEAEIRLIWQSASPLKWLLLLSAVGAGIVPGGATAAFLLLLTPAIAEVAARERIHGTAGLVFSHPGVGSSAVVWKTAATSLFVFGLATPAIVRAVAGSWSQGLAFLTGLLFVVSLSTSAGYITGGSRLFTAAYVPLWYASLSGGVADFTGSFGGGLDVRTRLIYVGAALLALASALAVERWRRRA
jgi:hypothetical protein